MKLKHHPLTVLAVTASLALLGGCGTDPTAADPATAVDETAGHDHDIVLVDGWVKATDETMTGVFGTLTNASDHDLHLVEVRSEVAGLTELHVTVDDGAGGRMMQKTEDGFAIPAGGEHVLEPGGDHLMLMRLTRAIETGEDVELSLVLDDGQDVPVTVTARAFTGAEEHYAPGHGEHGDRDGDDDGHGDGDGDGDDGEHATEDQ